MLLFARVDVLGVAWLRIASAALIFALWRRPWRVWRHLDRRTRGLLLLWAAVLAVMNSCFYLAIDRLPLGTVAAIEFLPVIGFVFAVANALLFAAYIVLSHRVAQSPAVRGIDGLALSMLIASVVAAPIGLADAVPAFTDPVALAAGIGVGVSSSGVGLVIVGVALRREPHDTNDGASEDSPVDGPRS